MFRRSGNQHWQKCFGLWAFIGTNGAGSGSIRAAGLTRLEVIPPTRAPSIVPIFQPMFYRLEVIGTVSKSVSESNERLPEILTV